MQRIKDIPTCTDIARKQRQAEYYQNRTDLIDYLVINQASLKSRRHTYWMQYEHERVSAKDLADQYGLNLGLVLSLMQLIQTNKAWHTGGLYGAVPVE
ncbi:hypothetical protein EXU30_19710 [Shewanella maritima]|uniref:Uncharacterized protein n=1 Tax=Shewanella maritima TaxID=2520507 RepID=A0A411PM93_9GAMM|nr:hypothetical protein [Shewanella maritima]QBF84652.1 hypothetical protein EXU30_19710 [Shewanella maritima]